MSDTQSDLDNDIILNYVRNFLIDEHGEYILPSNKLANLKEFIESDIFLEKVNSRIDRTVGELFFMVLNYSIENALSVQDSVARAPVKLGIKQFNGKFGCSWCEHPGVWAFGSMRYPILEQIPRPREHQSMLMHMLQVEPGETILGILYPSPFINLLKLNIVYGFVPDYMHCVLEGVAKQLTDHYSSSMTEIEIKVLDEILKYVKYPCQVSRLTRPVSVRNDWSAREWENFILFSSVPVFSTILSNKLLNHWMLLVEICFSDGNIFRNQNDDL
ncbi:uncharacterized protein LOC103317669 isoform X2 [Nasonia vitripennis]|uniref:Uncharacterized protein n=1 Tax=Nasonia vitripennis TaxID=7425 RepID=A0A7M7R436_NASVI|nr:uncharacterized protein LOC103317669 isoform X2 [Nasonia vitripennis]XP_032458120.1 uncharacterized protein LOC103317669 isoform X2 [Nasonia vitripennis]